MTKLTPDQGEFCHELAKEKVFELFGEELEIDERIENSLSYVGLIFPELTEEELRELLHLAGVDLNDEHNFERAREIVSWYVSTETIELSDLHQPSLVDPATTLHLEGNDNQHFIDRINSVKDGRSGFLKLVLKI
jgi:hypothetical protein